MGRMLETEAGPAGTQPARDNLVEASKRREGWRDRALPLRVAPPQFFCGPSTSHAQGSARRSGDPLRPHSFPPFPTHHFDASHASENPGVRGRAPRAAEARGRRTNWAKASGQPVLHRDPFDDVAGDAALAPVIQSRRSWIGVTRQVLHVFQRNALLQQVSDGRHTKRMGR